MSPASPPPPPPPPPRPPYEYVISNRDTAGIFSLSGTSVTEGGRYSIAPPQPAPQLGICIADRSETARILQLPGLEREEAIKNLSDACLKQLGITAYDRDVSTRTEPNSDSELILIITFLNLALLTVTKVAEAVKGVTDSASAWAKFILSLPTMWGLIRRAVGLGYRVTLNEQMLVGLTINYALTNGHGPGLPVDFCLIEPVQYFALSNMAARARRDIFGILTCDELPRPSDLYGFIVNRAGDLLAYGSTHWARQHRSNRAPTYELLQSATYNNPSEADISSMTKIAAVLPSTSKGIERSELRVGIFSRMQGTIYLWPSERARTEIKDWLPMAMTLPPADTSLVN